MRFKKSILKHDKWTAASESWAAKNKSHGPPTIDIAESIQSSELPGVGYQGNRLVATKAVMKCDYPTTIIGNQPSSAFFSMINLYWPSLTILIRDWPVSPIGKHYEPFWTLGPFSTIFVSLFAIRFHSSAMPWGIASLVSECRACCWVVLCSEERRRPRNSGRWLFGYGYSTVASRLIHG